MGHASARGVDSGAVSISGSFGHRKKSRLGAVCLADHDQVGKTTKAKKTISKAKKSISSDDGPPL